MYNLEDSKRIARNTAVSIVLTFFCSSPVFGAASYATSYASSYSGGIVWDPFYWGPHITVVQEVAPAPQYPQYEPQAAQSAWNTWMPLQLESEGMARIYPQAEIPWRTIKWQEQMESRRLVKTQAGHL